jgi:hypothetical protein
MQQDNDEKINEEEGVEDIYFETTSDLEYIQAAYFALSSVEDIDTAIMSKSDEARVKRIKRKSLVIIDECLKTLYDEIIEDDPADSGND